jgi:hypothetical protein
MFLKKWIKAIKEHDGLVLKVEKLTDENARLRAIPHREGAFSKALTEYNRESRNRVYDGGNLKGSTPGSIVREFVDGRESLLTRIQELERTQDKNLFEENLALRSKINVLQYRVKSLERGTDINA